MQTFSFFERRYERRIHFCTLISRKLPRDLTLPSALEKYCLTNLANSESNLVTLPPFVVFLTEVDG